MLKDGDLKFQLGVVKYTCFGQQNSVITIQSMVDDRSSDGESSTTAWFLCSSPEMRRGRKYADVTIEHMESVPLLQPRVITELKPDERWFFTKKPSSNPQTFRLRSAVSGPSYYLAVTENMSETLGNEQRCYALCMKKFSGTDDDKPDPEI